MKWGLSEKTGRTFCKSKEGEYQEEPPEVSSWSSELKPEGWAGFER